MKTAARIIAVIMAVMSLFTYTLSEANSVLAEELREQRELDEAIAGIQEAWEGTEPEELTYSGLVGEEKERRGEYTKHFRRGDGLVEAVTYPYPVHIEQEEEWVDIDNRLELVTLGDGRQVYRNRANDFEVSFGTSLNSEKLVEVSYGGHGLSWKLSGACSAVGEVEAEAGEPAEQTDEERDMGLRFP